MINGDVSLDFHIAVFCLVDVCVLKWVQRINISKIADYLLSGKKKVVPLRHRLCPTLIPTVVRHAFGQAGLYTTVKLCNY